MVMKRYLSHKRDISFCFKESEKIENKTQESATTFVSTFSYSINDVNTKYD